MLWLVDRCDYFYCMDEDTMLRKSSDLPKGYIVNVRTRCVQILKGKM